jgi:hypothetical protein
LVARRQQRQFSFWRENGEQRKQMGKQSANCTASFCYKWDINFEAK